MNENNGNGNGKSQSAPGQQNKPDTAKQNSGKAIGKETAYGQLKKNLEAGPLKMDTVDQRYLYDRFSINVMNEYTGHGSPVRESPGSKIQGSGGAVPSG